MGIVRRLDPQARLAIVQFERDTREIPDDLDETSECTVVANPATQWPFLKLPDRRRGVLVGLSRATHSGPQALILFEEWVPTEFGVTSAAFINPNLGLGFGDILIAAYERGQVRVNVPREFVTVQARVKAVVPSLKPEEPRNQDRPAGFRHLLGEDD